MKPSLAEQATINFYEFDYKGRGYYHFPFCVEIEPPFKPFSHYQIPNNYPKSYDGGKVPSYFKQLTTLFSSKEKELKVEEKPFLPKQVTSKPTLIGLEISFPKRPYIDKTLFVELLNMLCYTESNISFEIIGAFEKITIQIVCSEKDKMRVKSHFKAYFSTILFNEIDALELPFNNYDDIAICDFGMEEEFMRTVETPQNFNIDGLTSVFATLENLQQGDIVVYQILFKGVVNSWSKSIINSVSDSRGNSFFVDAPEMLQVARNKVSKPLFAVVVRLATQSLFKERTQYLASEVIRTISTFSKSEFNRLIPLSNEGYKYQHHIENLFYRQTNRLGMLLNTDELVSLVHYPNESVVSTKLGFTNEKTKKAPQIVLQDTKGCCIGINSHLQEEQNVYLTKKQRLKHIHIIGATGVGKSTLIANMILDDIEKGNGIALFDPHGDICDDILLRIPAHRKEDVIIIDPSDSGFPIGFNLLHATTDAEKIVLSSDLVSAFKRHATAWGDNMTAVLSNAINAFLESSTGGTLIELKRFLIEEKFRNSFLENVDDNSIHYYWQHEYPMVKKGIAPLLTRIDTFLRPKIIRYMLTQKSGIDFKECIENKKIVLLKLSQGLIGEDNSYLLGSIFISKFNQVALSRQSISKEKRHPFYIYMDEFQNFITPSITSMLSGVRKYGIGLVLAHQELSQIEESKILNSVISNPFTRICFRLGDNDARKLESGFSFFEQNDLQSLGTGQVIMRVGSSANDFSLTTPKLTENIDSEIKKFIVDNTRNKYTKNRSEIKELLDNLLPKIKKKSLDKKDEEKFTQTEKEKNINVIPIPVPTSVIEEIEIIPSEIKIEKPTTPFEKQKETYLEQAEEQEVLRQHRSLQYFVRTMAVQRGFKATLEEKTSNGGRIDVGLLKDDIRIAIEISVTNTVDYEVQNIQKCIDNGYSLVYMISNNEKHLQNIKEQSFKIISKKLHSKIHFFPSEELSLYLDALNPTSITKEKRVRGYRVKVNYKTEDVDINKQKSIANIIMDALRKK
jgi:DNA helicase HerA-like ATPase